MAVARCNKRVTVLLSAALICVIVVGLAGCDSSATTPSAASSPLATATSLPTATLFPTEPPTPATTLFPCPETADGSFYDSVSGLRFTNLIPEWNERNCAREVAADGTKDLVVGSLFRVFLVPRRGLTIQQWVNQQMDRANETVTLTKLSVPGARDADVPAVALTANASKPLDAVPFAPTMAIVAGTQLFYVVDVVYPLLFPADQQIRPEQATAAIVTTFQVP